MDERVVSREGNTFPLEGLEVEDCDGDGEAEEEEPKEVYCWESNAACVDEEVEGAEEGKRI